MTTALTRQPRKGQIVSAGRVHRPRTGSPRQLASEAQRLRIVDAMVRVACDQGVQSASVARVVKSARVSRKTFYDLFADRDDCALAALEQAVALAADRAGAACEPRERWVDRVRAGLLALLQFCDEEPKLARLCVLHSTTAGPEALARRTEVIDELVAVVGEGRVPERRPRSPVTAEGLVNGTVGVIHARLRGADSGKLTDPLNPLMSFIVLPYLGPGAARRELHRRPPALSPRLKPDSAPDALDGMNVRLTYRTMRVLAAIAARPGLSNTQASEQAGIVDQGQISKLMGRLARVNLVENRGEGQNRGEANAWYLTPRGEQLERTVGRELLGVGA